MDNEDELRSAEQSRALQLHAPSGAVVRTAYLERRQEFIAVNRNDLADLKIFDGLEAGLLGVGGFFFSGAVWLGVDKYFGASPRLVPAAVALCAMSAVFGLVMLGAGIVLRVVKRRRIDRIFSETRPIA